MRAVAPGTLNFELTIRVQIFAGWEGGQSEARPRSSVAPFCSLETADFLCILGTVDLEEN